MMKILFLFVALVSLLDSQQADAFSQEKETSDSSAATHFSDPEDQAPHFGGSVNNSNGIYALDNNSQPINSLSAVPDQYNNSGYAAPSFRTNTHLKN